MIKIDKGIDLPVSKRRFPFDVMEVGDSFMEEGITSNCIHSHIRYAHKVLPGTKFEARRLGYQHYRVWRVK
jgi:hypothetical protein